MKLTKHAHACISLENEQSTIVIDPGTFTPDAAEVIRAAAAVLITHEHFDHFDEDAVRGELEARSDLVVYGPRSVVDRLGERQGQVRLASDGASIELFGFRIRVFANKHAVIHPDIPSVDNVGYLINATLFDPGDSYLVPGVDVDTLLLPTSGPWTKLGDAANYIREVHPNQVIQIHELMLSDLGQTSTANFLGETGLTGVPFHIVPVGESIEL